MEKPLVHLNGSSGEFLLEGYAEAASKLRAALLALEHTAPNARDYYPRGEESFRKARSEHDSRVQVLMALLGEFYEIMEHVTDSMESRQQRKDR